MKKAGNYIKEFALRGIIAMGFGPIVLSVVYGILGLLNVVNTISVFEMVKGIVAITALAFLAGGITVVFQIEEIGLSTAITIHGVVLYICYAIVYLVNGWLAEGAIPFLVFTAIFVVGYLLVWIVIYLITKNSTDKLNKSIKI